MTDSEGAIMERRARIFRERALKLAAVPEREEPGEWLDVVEFLVGEDRYALEFPFVKEVFPPDEITPLPCAPSFMAGVVNLRGKIVPVVDIKILFGTSAPLPSCPRVIILTDGERMLGLLADEISGIRRVKRNVLHPPLPNMTGKAAAYAAGVTGENLTVLDGGEILKDRGLIVDEEP